MYLLFYSIILYHTILLFLTPPSPAQEFRKAMRALGLDLPTADVNAVFDGMDPDGSGEIEYKVCYVTTLLVCYYTTLLVCRDTKILLLLYILPYILSRYRMMQYGIIVE